MQFVKNLLNTKNPINMLNLRNTKFSHQARYYIPYNLSSIFAVSETSTISNDLLLGNQLRKNRIYIQLYFYRGQRKIRARNKFPEFANKDFEMKEKGKWKPVKEGEYKNKSLIKDIREHLEIPKNKGFSINFPSLRDSYNDKPKVGLLTLI